MKIKFVIASLILAGSSIVHADPIEVSYEIGSYSTGGYSASWLHEATGCVSTGPAGAPLYMCGARTDISGTINGMLDNGFLAVTGGMLNVGGTDHRIRGGNIGDFDELVPGTAWNLRVRGLGNFLFEPLGMGPGSPNYFDGTTMILWGQNRPAYRCSPNEYCNGRDRWGIDLYAKRVEVAEPATLALFGIGVLAMGLIRRRRTAV